MLKFIAAVVLGLAFSIGPAFANLIVERELAGAEGLVAIQCGTGGEPTFTARVDFEARIISITFTDGSKDTAEILGIHNGILVAKTSEGALLAFRGYEWAISVDGGQSAIGGGSCRPISRI